MQRSLYALVAGGGVPALAPHSQRCRSLVSLASLQRQLPAVSDRLAHSHAAVPRQHLQSSTRKADGLSVLCRSGRANAAPAEADAPAAQLKPPEQDAGAAHDGAEHRSPFGQLGVDGRLVVGGRLPTLNNMLHACGYAEGTARAWNSSVPEFSVGVLQAKLRSQDIVEPTAVQTAAIPRMLQGGNLAVQCYTGSGKVCNSHVGSRLSMTTILLCYQCLD